ncbi:MAG TPA: patatin-like phospholipase family protein [Gemmataceae bacterium]|nr:patatin-like phospholipase family protein [Gemmataceae bacterium]
MTHLRLHFRVALCLPACAGLLLLAGCLSMRGGTPSPNSATAAEDCVDAETLNRIVAQLAEDDSVKPGGPRYNVLVLSTGGPYGAFSAGMLVGWSEAGTRPKFDCVTGVSTGALVSVFAFVGPAWDDKLASVLSDLNAEKIYRMRGPVAMLRRSSFASSEPLQRLIEDTVDMELLRAVANAHAEGRRLYVGTTNLETKRLAVWDMGAIASRGDAEALKLFQTIMLASCSIPGFFEPVPIDVQVNGQSRSELHVDGGASASMFLRLPEQAQSLRGRRPLAGSNLYIIVAGKLYADPAPVRPGFIPVAGSSISSLMYAEARGDLYRLFTTSLASGMKFQLAAVPQQFAINPNNASFGPKEIKQLYEEGVRAGHSPNPWRSLPPGSEDGEQAQLSSHGPQSMPQRDIAR